MVFDLLIFGLWASLEIFFVFLFFLQLLTEYFSQKRISLCLGFDPVAFNLVYSTKLDYLSMQVWPQWTPQCADCVEKPQQCCSGSSLHIRRS